MKSKLLFFTLLIANVASAHSGHPGSTDHGTLTHLVIGILSSVSLAGLAWGITQLRSAKREPVRVRKDSTHG